MSDKQKLAIMQFICDPTIDIMEIQWTSYFSEPSNSERILRVEFFDNGRNRHSIGISPEGFQITYDV